MEKLTDSFWMGIKRLADQDTSLEVPNESVQSVMGIFQVEKKRSRLSNVFQLVPSFTGAVRRAESTSKFLYQIGEECMVQLEKSFEPDGFHLTGFVHGLEDGGVSLMGDEFTSEAISQGGMFEFEEIPSGVYNLAIESEGEVFWITSLELGVAKA